MGKITDLFRLHKSKAILCLCFVSVYLAGVFSANSFLQENTSAKLIDDRQTDYTTKDRGQPNEVVEKKDIKSTEQTQTSNVNSKKTSTQNPDDCYIKGSKSKVYHIPGGAFYERTTNPISCFNSEEEAQSAGFIKSSR